jgi:hypothetical protein
MNWPLREILRRQWRLVMTGERLSVSATRGDPSVPLRAGEESRRGRSAGQDRDGLDGLNSGRHCHRDVPSPLRSQVGAEAAEFAGFLCRELGVADAAEYWRGARWSGRLTAVTGRWRLRLLCKVAYHDHGYFTSQLALAYAADGDAEQAATVGLRAVPVARTTNSVRTQRELRRLVRRLDHAPGGGARELRHQVAARS